MECRWIRTAEHDLRMLREAAQGLAVLPLSSIESHGPHLPTGSDPLCLEHLLERVAERETVAILPQLMYSYVLSARRLPGAIHIDSMLLIRFVENICDETHRNGFDKIALLHGHGGCVPLLQMFCARIAEKAKPYAIYAIPVLPGMREVYDEILETRHRGHACELETSLDLVAAPELVRLDKLQGRIYEPQPLPDVGEALTPLGWACRWPEMVAGDPSKATREKGEKIFAAWTDRVVDILQKIKADKVAPRVMARHAKASGSHGAPAGHHED